MASQQYVKKNSLSALIVTNHVSNSRARKRARYQVPSTYSGTALAARLFPSHSGSSAPIVRHSKDPLKAENRGRAQKEGTGKSRCTPFDAQHHL